MLLSIFFLVHYLFIYLFALREVRSSVLEESLKKFGVRRFGKDDVQKMEWNDLEAKTGHWIEVMHIAVAVN